MNSEINLENLLSCAVSAAHAAGDHALKHAGRRNEVIKTFAHDVKLKLDIECQERAESVIHTKFPDHQILGEENLGVESELARHSPVPDSGWRGGDVEWIIDPIDGTVNFSHGLPFWCCSIAVRHREKVVAGVIYAPATNELYTATIDKPALCNGVPIKVSKTSVLSGSIVFTGVNKSIDPNLPRFAIFEKIASNVQRPRIFGSAALDMCHVACGHADGYFESGIYIWDVAAAGLIVRQAGGKAEILGYQDNSLLFLATNGLIHEDLKNLVKTGSP